MKHMIEIPDIKADYFTAHPEFVLVRFIENFRKQNTFTNKRYIYCEACGSDNIGVYSPEIGDIKIYDLDYLSFRVSSRGGDIVMFALRKEFNSFSIKPGGHNNIKTENYILALKAIKELVFALPGNYFEEQIKGDTFVCLSVEPDTNQNSKVEIEKFYSYGLTRNEILQNLEEYYKVKLGIPVNSTLSLKEPSSISNNFKGTLFNSTYMGRIGYACFNYNDKITIIHKCEYNETVRDFISRNRDNHFTIDNTIPSFERNGKTIFTAKKLD
jgi:hypothetical protein